MPLPTIDRGATPDDAAADDLYTAFGKVNSNAATIEAALAALTALPVAYSGTDDPPSGSLGKDGDLYFHFDSGDVWRRESGTWVKKLVAGGPPPPPPPP